MAVPLTSAAFNSRLLEGRGGSVPRGGRGGRGGAGGAERLTQLPARGTAKLCVSVFYRHPNGTILMIPL